VLEGKGAAGHFVLVGTCSGAYWSFHCALRDERAVAAFMLNPRALDRLQQTDKQLLFAFSGDEPLHEEFQREARLEQLERRQTVELDLLPGRDHTLRPAESQRCAHAALDRALDRELRPIAAAR
jgi:dienelactone hydrolase